MVTESLIIKFLGSFAGAILALVFIPPKTLSGFFRRSAASLITGPIFCPVTHAQMGWADTWEYWLASAALTAFISWWLLGIVVTVAKKWIGEKAAGEVD
jgi:hypothetical protein